MGGPTPGKNSDIETAYLRMTLEHDTGVLRGTVLQGQFEGRLLEEMTVEDIVGLLQECRVNDPQSADVLETYLDRVHGVSGALAAGEPPRVTVRCRMRKLMKFSACIPVRATTRSGRPTGRC